MYRYIEEYGLKTCDIEEGNLISCCKPIANGLMVDLFCYAQENKIKLFQVADWTNLFSGSSGLAASSVVRAIYRLKKISRSLRGANRVQSS